MNDIYTVIDSPVGELLLAGCDQQLRRLAFVEGGDDHGRTPISAQSQRDDDAFPQARQQLDEYFRGQRRDFDLELDLRGTAWELSVWNALLAIPYGETRAYGEIAREVCTIKASRAVGLANGRNPVAIIVPCHRVIGANGSLTGYGGGLERKRTLLDLEAGRLALTL